MVPGGRQRGPCLTCAWGSASGFSARPGRGPDLPAVAVHPCISAASAGEDHDAFPSSRLTVTACAGAEWKGWGWLVTIDLLLLRAVMLASFSRPALNRELLRFLTGGPC